MKNLSAASKLIGGVKCFIAIEGRPRAGYSKGFLSALDTQETLLIEVVSQFCLIGKNGQTQ